MIRMLKKISMPIIMAAAVSAGAENIRIPSWLKIQSNGMMEIGDVRIYMAASNGKTQVREMVKHSKLVRHPSTLELDSRIWEVSYRLASWDKPCTVFKKLTVQSGSAVNWRFRFEGYPGHTIRNIVLQLHLPETTPYFSLDGRKIKFPKKYSGSVITQNCNASRIAFPVDNTVLELSGNFIFRCYDLRKWRQDGFFMEIDFNPKDKEWLKAELEFDLRYTGIRIPLEDFKNFNGKFTTLSLDRAVNNTIQDTKANDGICGWTDKGPYDDFSAFSRYHGRVLFGHIPFEIADPARNGGKQVVAVAHRDKKVNLPEKVRIPVDHIKARGLYFLHCGAWISPEFLKSSPGQYVVTYDDETKSVIPLVNFENIFNWWSVGPSPQVIVGFSLQSGSNAGAVIYPWTNPHPEKSIREITLEIGPEATKSMLMLLGITAVDQKPVVPEEPLGKSIDDSNWIPFVKVDEKRAKGTILDVSRYVEAPAGKHGFVHADGELLRFEDGKEARFIGTVLASHGNFLKLERKKVTAVIEKLRRMGVNIVRLMAGTEDERSYLFKKGSFEFDPARIDQFCFVISELKRNGIYIQFDMPGYRMHKEKDPDLEGTSTWPESYVSDRVRQVQLTALEKILSYPNPYTGMPLAKDPVLVMVMVINECSMLYQPDRDKIKNKVILAECQKKYNSWLLAQKLDRNALLKKWGTLDSNEDPADGSVEIPMSFLQSKYSEARIYDIRRFLVDLHKEYFDSTRAVLKRTGCKALLIGSNHWTSDLLDLYSNARDTDIVDRHSYWAHPVVDNGWDYHQVLFNPGSSLKAEASGLIEQVASRRVIGKPLAQTEWTSAGPNEFRAEASFYMPAYAMLHGWNLFQFEYTFLHAIRDLRPMRGPFTLSEDQAHLALWPLTSVMFHRGDVRRSPDFYAVNVTREQVLTPGFKINGSEIARAALRGRSGINFDRSMDAKSNPKLLPGKDEKKIVSVTGELIWEKRGVFTLDTPLTQGFAGFAAGETIRCKDFSFRTNNDFCVVGAVSRDDKPLAESGRILLTTVARCWNTGMKFNRLRNHLTQLGTLPIIFQPVKGEIRLRTKKQLRAWTIDFTGIRGKELPFRRENGELILNIGNSVHYELSEK